MKFTTDKNRNSVCCDMVKYELRVTSYELRVPSYELKAEKHDLKLKSASSNS